MKGFMTFLLLVTMVTGALADSGRDEVANAREAALIKVLTDLTKEVAALSAEIAELRKAGVGTQGNTADGKVTWTMLRPPTAVEWEAAAGVKLVPGPGKNDTGAADRARAVYGVKAVTEPAKDSGAEAKQPADAEAVRQKAEARALQLAQAAARKRELATVEAELVRARDDKRKHLAQVEEANRLRAEAAQLRAALGAKNDQTRALEEHLKKIVEQNQVLRVMAEDGRAAAAQTEADLQNELRATADRAKALEQQLQARQNHLHNQLAQVEREKNSFIAARNSELEKVTKERNELHERVEVLTGQVEEFRGTIGAMQSQLREIAKVLSEIRQAK